MKLRFEEPKLELIPIPDSVISTSGKPNGKTDLPLIPG